MTVVPCELLEWDTAFWGVKVARVTAGSMTDESRAEIDRWCDDNGVSCVYFLTATDDAETTLAAERGGFFATDVRITLRKEVDGRRSGPPQVHIREAHDGDLEALQAIARSSHGTTRFYHDPHFPDDRCGELYAEWIQSTYDSGVVILVVDDESRAVAYVTCEVREPNTGYIGLIAVDEARRGQGLGRALAAAADNWMVDAGVTHLAVVTQERNVAAVRLIEGAGYGIVSRQIWFHKWYDR
jgi:dTDP-4-amino-4,6-dideoxy-D-galactose acyltransferase